jgi:hypothetical protein
LKSAVNNIEYNRNMLHYKGFGIGIIMKIKNNLFYTRKTELTLEKIAFGNLNPLYKCIHMFYMLPYLYIFSLPTAIPWRVWIATGKVRFCNTSEPIGSGKQFWSDKMISPNQACQS